MREHFPVSAIKPFVRQGLGCSCPDTVFEKVTSEWREADGGYRRLSAGGRLLVYLVPVGPADGLEERVIGLLRQGVRERDAAGYNRLRLVVVGPLSVPRNDALFKRFKAIAGEDQWLHLHLLAEDEVRRYQSL